MGNTSFQYKVSASLNRCARYIDNYESMELGGKKIIILHFEKGRAAGQDSSRKGTMYTSDKKRIVQWLILDLLIDYKEGLKYGNV